MLAEFQLLGGPLLRKTLLISLLFHLSAITVFSVVIYFPRESRRYAQLAFVQEARATALPETAITDALLRPERITEVESVSLPRLSFDPTGHLQADSLRVGGQSFYEETPDARADSWERFGVGIQRLRASIRDIAGAGEDSEVPASSAGADLFGAGYRVSLEWGPTPARELIYSPPVFFRSAVPAEGAEFFLNIGPAGDVVRVVSLSAERSPFETESLEFLQRCRFASGEGGRSAELTLRVHAATEAAP
jgi:hypothetical protein